MKKSFYHKGLTSTFWDSWQLCEETTPLRYIYLVFVKIEKEYWILVPSGLICSHRHKLLRHLIPPYSYIFTFSHVIVIFCTEIRFWNLVNSSFYSNFIISSDTFYWTFCILVLFPFLIRSVFNFKLQKLFWKWKVL